MIRRYIKSHKKRALVAARPLRNALHKAERESWQGKVGKCTYERTFLAERARKGEAERSLAGPYRGPDQRRVHRSGQARSATPSACHLAQHPDWLPAFHSCSLAFDRCVGRTTASLHARTDERTRKVVEMVVLVLSHAREESIVK